MRRVRLRTGPSALFGAMLLVALIVFLPMRAALGWFGVGDGLSSARERHADAVTRLGETQAQVAALRDIQRGRARPLTGTLADVVRVEADQAGFTLASLDQDGARVRVSIQSARPTALVAWLARLERIGVLVDTATMTDNGNKAVGVALVLRARAA